MSGKKIKFLLLLLCSINLKAQILNLANYNQDDGLESSYIYDIAQDKNGFLVISTGEGLVYSEGISFNKYDSLQKSNQSVISSLFLDSHGKMFLGNMENGISEISTNKKIFPIQQTKSIESPITCFTERNNGIYFGTRIGKIGILENNKVTYILLDGASFINSMVKYKSLIYLATDNGIYVLNDKLSVSIVEQTQGENYTSMCMYNRNKLFCGTSDGTLNLFEISEFKTNILTKKYSEILCKNIAIKSIIQSKIDKIFVGTWGKGIYSCIIDNKSSTINKTENFIEKNGLANLFINAIFQDRNSNLWIGTFGGGLFKYFSQHFRLINKSTGLTNDYVKSVCIDNEKIYIGSLNGLQVLNNRNLDSSILFNSKNKFFDDEVNSIKKLSESKFLIGTTNNSLQLFDTKNKTFSNYFKRINFQKYPKTVNHIQVIGDSIIYVSSLDGLFVIKLKTNKCTLLTTNEGLPHNNITFTYLDRKNRLWILASKSPPAIFKNDSITLYKDIPNFKSYSASSICENEHGDLYISTLGDGIFKYSNEVFSQLTTKNGLASNFVTGLVYVNNKDIIISSHPNGLSVINNGSIIQSYTDKSILKGYENTLNSISLTNNSIYFGSSQGLSIFQLNDEVKFFAPPSNCLLNISINKKSYSTTDTVINLPYNIYDLKFDYIGLELTYPKSVTYKYQLVGVDPDFNYTKERSIEYNKLEEGEYTFILTSINYKGKENENLIKIHIIIDKPIYKKLWFILLIFALFSFCIYLFIKIRTKKLISDNLLLEKKINEKTADIATMNKVLEDKNHDITSSIDYAKRIQTVLLPEMESISKHLDVFVFYKPRDIVSGDFYWYFEENDYIYIAAVDCTGHGVPGAFMSLIGTTFLNQIMIELNNPFPSEILSALDNKIVKSLRQNKSEDKIGDGMDMGLCRINIKTKELIYSSAGRPLYFIQNKVFNEIKANIYSIGGFNEGVIKGFKDHRITYNENDAFYMFSDGYGDQFGGEKNKRFSTKRMKALFFNIYKETTDLQSTLIDFEFNSWRGSQDQIDDVLVIGIKLK